MLKLFVLVSLILAVSPFDDDAFKNVQQLIERHGYPYELHTVKTSDDYLLGVHRISHGLDNAQQSDKKVVLIMHQFLGSSADYVNMADKSLAFLLADRNYDVWLGNARGNTHSRSHVTLDPDSDAKFWSFTWDDIGTKDLPAIIDYIRAETKEEKLYYIGHGQGSTIFYVMASKKTEYQENIKMMAALAPIAHMESMPNPLFRILDTLLRPFDENFTIQGILNMLVFILSFLDMQVNEIFKHSDSGLFAKVCDDDAMFVEICAAVMGAIYGFDSDQLDRAKVPVILTNSFAGGSYKQLDKYLDYYHKDNFGKSYDLSKVNVPTGIFYGTNDWLVSVKDIDHLVEDLGENVVLTYKVPYKDFNHVDFLYAADAKELVYDALFKFLESGDEKK